MIGSLLESFQRVVLILPFLGLTFDAVGAILVLGPELPGVAWFMTRWEREDLRVLKEELEEGHVITSDHPHFADLLIAIHQGEVEGPTPRPFSNTAKESSFRKAYDEAVGSEEGVEIRNSGETVFSVSYDELDRWVESYRGVDWLYYVGGAFLLVMGFFLQAVAELANFYPALAFIVCLIGFIVITGYMIWVYSREESFT